MDCMSNNAIVTLRAKAQNDKLSDLMHYTSKTVMKQVQSKLPISVSRRNFLLAVVLKRLTYMIAAKLLEK